MSQGMNTSGSDPEKRRTTVHPGIDADLGELLTEALNRIRQEPPPSPVARFTRDVFVGVVTAAVLWLASGFYTASISQQTGVDPISTMNFCEAEVMKARAG